MLRIFIATEQFIRIVKSWIRGDDWNYERVGNVGLSAEDECVQ
jgi:hypothetical protein